MLEFFPFKKTISFMSWGKLTTTISLVTFLFSVWALWDRGLNLGVDFTGGTLIEVRTDQAADLNRIRSTLEKTGLPEISVQNFGSSRDVLIRLPAQAGATAAQTSNQIMAALQADDPKITLQKVDFVGPAVGKELYDSGALALLVVAFGIMAYLAIRFEWRFAVAGMIANLHDIVIILGLFAFFQWEFTLTVLAGVLAILGYSVNESVVVFDRIRENIRKMRGATIPQIIDDAITRTMSRTIITHGSTQIMVLSMLFFGGEALHNFALALTIGILFGIYSSVLVASPLLLMLGVKREHFIKPVEKKEEAVV
ncbi:MAG TPA: protein translocase subunit SecF [Thiobacillus sp.]|nr:MAG: protein translocase subunit SecF [Hydrogenophilales bacterium 12-64-13]OYZ06104.1 MAG: protein translocase subunit SecF [Hydrogenophilales bacterium 16-64-46]OZA38997.1 MAG: protein translocase subunit SecF [Hydrogenophilales bacterium 17-64-34]HQS82708.1 protein translocase subunit SecF [Thiobacillus sp.]HQT01253.1 protein translocase subunit SecF [Thiobacillus sp.]